MISAICNTCFKESFFMSDEIKPCPYCGGGMILITASINKRPNATKTRIERIRAAVGCAYEKRHALITKVPRVEDMDIAQRDMLDHLNYVIQFFLNAELVELDLEELLDAYAPQTELQHAI